MAVPGVQIISQTETTQFVEGLQTAVRGVKVSFYDTVSGQYGSVFVQDAYYSPENVDQAITAKVTVLRQIQGTPAPKPAATSTAG